MNALHWMVVDDSGHTMTTTNFGSRTELIPYVEAWLHVNKANSANVYKTDHPYAMNLEHVATVMAKGGTA